MSTNDYLLIGTAGVVLCIVIFFSISVYSNRKKYECTENGCKQNPFGKYTSKESCKSNCNKNFNINNSVPKTVKQPTNNIVKPKNVAFNVDPNIVLKNKSNHLSTGSHSSSPPASKNNPSSPPAGKNNPSFPPAGKNNPSSPPAGKNNPSSPPAGKNNPSSPPAGKNNPSSPPAGKNNHFNPKPSSPGNNNPFPPTPPKLDDIPSEHSVKHSKEEFNSNFVTHQNVNNIQDQIAMKKHSTPYYATTKEAVSVLTDYDTHPYPRFYRGIPESTVPIVAEREAGWRPRQDNAYNSNMVIPETTPYQFDEGCDDSRNVNFSGNIHQLHYCTNEFGQIDKWFYCDENQRGCFANSPQYCKRGHKHNLVEHTCTHGPQKGKIFECAWKDRLCRDDSPQFCARPIARDLDGNPILGLDGKPAGQIDITGGGE